MSQTTFQPGHEAPAFSLSDAAGKTVRLADFRGRWLVLYFYPKDDTPGCTQEAMDFTVTVHDFERAGAAVVGISPDSVQSHNKFTCKYDLSIPLLSDPERAVLKAYGAWGIKKMYGRESEGVLRSTVLIDPQGRIARHWPKVKVDGHAAEVLATLKELARP